MRYALDLLSCEHLTESAVVAALVRFAGMSQQAALQSYMIAQGKGQYFIKYGEYGELKDIQRKFDDLDIITNVIDLQVNV